MRDLTKVRFITEHNFNCAALRAFGVYKVREEGFCLTIVKAGNFAYVRVTNPLFPGPTYKRFDLRVWDIFEVQRYMLGY